MTVDGQDLSGDHDVARLLRRLPPRPEPPRQMHHEVRAQVHAAWRLQTRARKAAGRRFAAVAASLLAAVVLWQVWSPQPAVGSGFALLRGDLQWSQDRSRWTPVAGERDPGTGFVRTAGGAVLAGGEGGDVQLRLRASSLLRLAQVGSLELLDGALYADTGERVRRAPALVIRTPRGTVRDIGTRFLVALDGAAVAVAVRDGRVELDDGGAVHAARAGTRLRLDGSGQPSFGAIPPWDREWAWASEAAPVPPIEGMSALVFLRWVARERGLELRFADTNARLRAELTTLHGDASRLAPAELLPAVMSSTDLRVEAGSPGVLSVALPP